jgi:uncharacterized protein (TIGR00375 family)
MRIIADFHVHSRYSRATARNLDLENLYMAAQVKGVDVVGSGDFSHPAWFAEIETKLEPAEAGLFRLKKEISGPCDREVPPSCRREVRFVLTTEISNIYKKRDRTRKNHNLVFAPDLDAVRRLNHRLGEIGNIRSDGRPILGLDARDLLEVVLEASAEAFLVPAHIWTPWFSVLGSKSGFDTIEECFDDLAGHVFAAETGLSSDPSMNWRVSSMDHIRLISNSDAHSPANLGREANCFDTELSYFALRDALKSRDGQGFFGTIEFFPQEGKYHLDGHRDCGVRLHPRQSAAHGGKCPVCGRALTVGVLSRVEELADRADGLKPATARPYDNLVPLADVLAEILQVGPKTVKAVQAYRSAVGALGPELRILQMLEPAEIERAGIPLLGEAIRRMRARKIEIIPGFDGEYGKIRIFSAQERARLQGQRPLFALGEPLSRVCAETAHAAVPRAEDGPEDPPVDPRPDLAQAAGEGDPENTAAGADSAAAGAGRGGPNAEQLRAVEHPHGALVIVAGPGTGKTFTLTRRIAHLIQDKGVGPESVLAVTFTNKAAEEMRARLAGILGPRAALPTVATFHGICLNLWREWEGSKAPVVIDEDEQGAVLADAVKMAAASGAAVTPNHPDLKAGIMRAKQNLLGPEDLAAAPGSDPAVAAVYRAYQGLLETQRVCDYEDLIFGVVARLESDVALRDRCRGRFRHIFVDEYQDINHGQYRFIRAIAPSPAATGGICVIGDPDQSIYGFRGSDCAFFNRFVDDYPGAGVITLARNYRSTDTILAASFQVIDRNPAARIRVFSGIHGIATIGFMEQVNEHAEAESISREIERLMGGTGYHSLDTGRVRDAAPQSPPGWADIAVLARTRQQLDILAEVFDTRGIPCQVVSRHQTLGRTAARLLLSLFKIGESLGAYADFERVAPLVVPGLGPKIVETFKAWCAANRLPLAEGLAGAARYPIPGLNRNQQLKLTGFAGRVAALRAETSGMTVRQRLETCSRDPALSAPMADAPGRAAVERLTAMAEDSEKDALAFLTRVALHTDADAHHPRAEKVALMSMHAAKGLEFAVVFVAGCEDGLIPFHRPDRSGADPQEERRLFYVAMTRARQRLYFTRARRRRLFGKTASRKPSPFVADIETELIAAEAPVGRGRGKKDAQLRLF